jgi:hypothetical protein
MNNKLRLVVSLVLPMILFSSFIALASCSPDTKKTDLPYGAVLNWKAYSMTEFRDKNNRVINEATWRETGLAELYEKTEVRVNVQNQGADGIVIFNAQFNSDDILGRDQQTTSFFLAKDEQRKITFFFWIKFEQPVKSNSRFTHSGTK